MEMRAGFPEFISTLRANNAGLPRQAKSLVMAGRHKSLKFDEILANARRSFGSLGGGGRQDVLITEEAVGPLESDGARIRVWHPESREVENDCSSRFSGGKTVGAASAPDGGTGSIAMEEKEDRGA